MILISGATGTNGQEVIKQLAEKGIKVRALVRNLEKGESLKPYGVELVEGDFSDPSSLEAALQGVDKALMLPPIAPDAVELQRNFIEAAKKAGTRYIVKFSAIGAASDSPMRLGRWHGDAEQLLADSGIAYCSLRPNGFMQNFLAFGSSIANQGVFAQPGGSSSISHIDVRDIAAAIVETLLDDTVHAGKAYTLTGPETLSFDQVAEIFSKVLGTPVRYLAQSPEEFKGNMLAWGQPEWLADTFNEMFALYRTGWGAEVTEDFTTITDRQPRTFEAFVRDYRQAFEPEAVAV
ncbi:MAG: SDR family oxidoreductase [Cyanobacteria bacterium J06632_3]